jgi:hypothetical protein
MAGNFQETRRGIQGHRETCFSFLRCCVRCCRWKELTALAFIIFWTHFSFQSKKRRFRPSHCFSLWNHHAARNVRLSGLARSSRCLGLWNHNTSWASEIIALPGFVRTCCLGVWDHYIAWAREIIMMPESVRSLHCLSSWGHHDAWVCEIIILPGLVRSLLCLSSWDHYTAWARETVMMPGFVRSLYCLSSWDHHDAWVCGTMTVSGLMRSLCLDLWDYYALMTLAVRVHRHTCPFAHFYQRISMTIWMNVVPLKVARPDTLILYFLRPGITIWRRNQLWRWLRHQPRSWRAAE